MRYLLAVNTQIEGKLARDATPAEWARLNDTFENVELTPEQIAAEIRAGHAIAAQHTGRRKAANWIQAQHIGIDLDNGAIEWDELISLPLVRDHAAIVHTTASHRPDNPRYRVLFLLEDPLAHPAGYRHVVECLLRAFDTADPHCRDASRLFFGAPGCSLLLRPANVLTSEDIANIVTAWPDLTAAADVDPDTPPPDLPRPTAQACATAHKSTHANGAIIPPDRISPRRLEAHRAALLHRITTAPDGEKWSTLRDIAITFGGYIAGGYYDVANVRYWLRDAIEGRRSTVANMPAAYRTIDLGLAYGQLSPLYYDADNGGQEHAAPADSRGDLRRRIIGDRLEELTRMIADAPDNSGDFDKWVVEYADLRRALEELATV